MPKNKNVIMYFNPSEVELIYLDLVKVMALVNLLQDKTKIKSYPHRKNIPENLQPNVVARQ